MQTLPAQFWSLEVRFHSPETRRRRPATGRPHTRTSTFMTHVCLMSMFRRLWIYSNRAPPLPTPDHPTPLPPPPDWPEQPNPGLQLAAGGSGPLVVPPAQCALSAPAGQVREQVSERSVSGARCRNTLVPIGSCTTNGVAPPPSDACEVGGDSKCQFMPGCSPPATSSKLVNTICREVAECDSDGTADHRHGTITVCQEEKKK